MIQPSAEQSYGVVGFCWGGSTVFQHALTSSSVGAVVVYYGGNPPPSEATRVEAPILGLYGADDARVNQTVAPMDSALEGLNKPYDVEIYAGAGHGFLRQQDGRDGANLEAAQKAWPRTVAFFRQNLGQ